MSSNLKEKYSLLYVEARELSEKTSLLKKRSRLLLVLQIVSLLLLLIYMVAVAPSFKMTDSHNEALLTFYSFVFLLFALIYFWMRNMNKKTRKLFFSVHSMCGDLSDMVDWTTMRKRQLYHQLDEKIQGSIDAFYEYSISLLCPYYGGKKLFLILQMLYQLELITCATMSLIWTFNCFKV